MATKRAVSLCWVTSPSTHTSALVEKILANKAAACVNVTKGAESNYVWEGEVKREKEDVLMIKTTKDRIKSIITLMEAHHPYDCPEVVSVDVSDGSEPYLDWVRDSVPTPENHYTKNWKSQVSSPLKA
eukprot:TRINITY_DN12121_c0_g1_i1.p1 TRINITY_DN12121_c0_g1~~TRINITY_DN12121_c0_g1_i1.p1  ORF type:complete len:145 (+),score=23.31 TRINITY_DN12121_c0_g1_i1:54-437(+)